MVVISFSSTSVFALIETDAFLDDGLIVLVQGYAGRFVVARPLEVAGLDFEHVVAAVPIFVDPVADRVAR